MIFRLSRQATFDGTDLSTISPDTKTTNGTCQNWSYFWKGLFIVRVVIILSGLYRRTLLYIALISQSGNKVKLIDKKRTWAHFVPNENNDYDDNKGYK